MLSNLDPIGFPIGVVSPQNVFLVFLFEMERDVERVLEEKVEFEILEICI